MGHPLRRRFDSKQDAEAWCRQLIRDEATGRRPDVGPMMVSDLSALYLRSVKKSGRSPATYTNYRHRLRDLVRFLDKQEVSDVGGITPEVIELYRLDMHDRLMPSTVGQALMVVSGLFSWAIRMRLVDDNPVRYVEIPRQRSERRAFTDKERATLLREAILIVSFFKWGRQFLIVIELFQSGF